MATRSIDDTLENLRTSLDRLQADLRRHAEAASDKIVHDTPEIAKRAKAVGQAVYEDGSARARTLVKAGRKLFDQASDSVTDARDNIKVVATRARDAITDAAETADGSYVATEVRQFVRQRPLASLCLAIAVGWLAGRVLDRD